MATELLLQFLYCLTIAWALMILTGMPTQYFFEPYKKTSLCMHWRAWSGLLLMGPLFSRVYLCYLVFFVICFHLLASLVWSSKMSIVSQHPGLLCMKTCCSYWGKIDAGGWKVIKSGCTSKASAWNQLHNTTALVEMKTSFVKMSLTLGWGFPMSMHVESIHAVLVCFCPVWM